MPWKDKNAWRVKRDPAKHRENQRKYRIKTGDAASTVARQRLRAAAIAALGGICIKCGFSDTRALEIDHVNNGGTKDRRTRTRWQMLKDIVTNGANGTFQLLCANCHQIKTHEEVWTVRGPFACSQAKKYGRA